MDFDEISHFINTVVRQSNTRISDNIFETLRKCGDIRYGEICNGIIGICDQRFVDIGISCKSFLRRSDHVLKINYKFINLSILNLKFKIGL